LEKKDVALKEHDSVASVSANNVTANYLNKQSGKELGGITLYNS